jgi:transposase-like protein
LANGAEGNERQAVRLHAAPEKPVLTSNAIEALHEKFKRRIMTQTTLPSAEAAAITFWAMLASGQIAMSKADGSQSLNEKPSGHAN